MPLSPMEPLVGSMNAPESSMNAFVRLSGTPLSLMILPLDSMNGPQCSKDASTRLCETPVSPMNPLVGPINKWERLPSVSLSPTKPND